MPPNEDPANQRDFSDNPQAYFKKSDYDTNIAPVIERIEHLEKRTKDHAALAASFKEAFEHDKDMDKTLVTLICDLIKTNDEVKKAIDSAVEKTDRKWWNGAWKKVLTGVSAVLLLVIGAIIGHYIK